MLGVSSRPQAPGGEARGTWETDRTKSERSIVVSSPRRAETAWVYGEPGSRVSAEVLRPIQPFWRSAERCGLMSEDQPSANNFRWDALHAGEPPAHEVFASAHSAAMFVRPGDLRPDTWFHDGHLRLYAMLNLPTVVPTCELSRGHGPIFMFGNDRRPALLDEVSVRLSDEEPQQSDRPVTARQACAINNVQGIIVTRQGRIVFEEYPGMDPSQRHSWMSVSKSAISMLLGMCVMQGRLDMAALVGDYVPELDHGGYGSFTVQQVADMDAEVSMNEADYGAPGSPFWEWGRAIGWFEDAGNWPGGVKQLLCTIERLPRRTGEAARKVFYTGSSSQVLAWVIERITGLPTSLCLEQHLWQHLGAVSNAAVSVDKRGVAFVGGGLNSTLRDLARFGQIWAGKGIAPDGTRIFSESWISENTSGRGLEIFDDWTYHNHSYSRDSTLCHQGHSGQMLWANPATETVVACFSSLLQPFNTEPSASRLLLLMAEAIDQHLDDLRSRAGTV
jgi:CubicO group peptidase (beta-lactamase class C family)